MSRASGVPLDELRPYLFLQRDRDATGHLLRVSGGLDSLVMGEGQILAQVKQVRSQGSCWCGSWGRGRADAQGSCWYSSWGRGRWQCGQLLAPLGRRFSGAGKWGKRRSVGCGEMGLKVECGLCWVGAGFYPYVSWEVVSLPALPSCSIAFLS